MLKFINGFISLILSLVTLLSGGGTPGNTGSLYKNDDGSKFKYSYGVFLGLSEDLSPCENFKTIVIDAQYLSEETVSDLKSNGHVIYSYINVGSLENFRDYYDRFKNLGLGEYENWDEEIWVDVSSKDWQNFILNELAAELKDKGIDGYFVDNCDVYYEYSEDRIYNGLCVIMEGLVETGLKVIINSGNDFADKYTGNGGDYSDIFTGINQETVFSSIKWKTGRFGTASKESCEFFRNYIEKYGKLGADIYLLEYTRSKKLAKTVDEYCTEHGFDYYISDSIELIG